MYASVRMYEGLTDTAEVARRVNEGFVPLVSAIDGFVAYYFVDAGGGVMCSTSVFEDRSGAEASDEKAAVWARESLSDLVSDPPAITEGEVVASGS
jgi:hypothetical protein